MGWQDILKNRRRDTAQEILISFREFTPIREITKEEEDRVLSSMYFDTRPLVYKRTLEFMKPFDEIKRDGLDFVFKFDIEGVPFTYKLPFLPDSAARAGRGIGEKAFDNFPKMDSTGMRFCIKATREMTNGDFMVTLLLASENNSLPPILTLPAYVERHMPETKMHESLSFPTDSNVRTIFDGNELDYKTTLLERIWEHVEGLDEMDWPKVFIWKINEQLKEYIPEELLGKW